jgi:hypothetical protein
MMIREYPLDLDKPIKAGEMVVAYKFVPRKVKGRIRRKRTGDTYLMRFDQGLDMGAGPHKTLPGTEGVGFNESVHYVPLTTIDIREDDRSKVAKALCNFVLMKIPDECFPPSEKGLANRSRFDTDHFQYFKLRLISSNESDERIHLVFEDEVKS